jgi:hypothetical protein
MSLLTVPVMELSQRVPVPNIGQAGKARPSLMKNMRLTNPTDG